MAPTGKVAVGDARQSSKIKEKTNAKSLRQSARTQSSDRVMVLKDNCVKGTDECSRRQMVQAELTEPTEITETRRRLFGQTINNNDSADSSDALCTQYSSKMGTITQMNSRFVSGSAEEKHASFLSLLDYEVLEELGSGSFSKVFKISKKGVPDRYFACKIFDLTKIDESWAGKCLKDEMNIMFRIFHSNIIHARDLIRTPNTAYIVMDYASNGNISSYLVKQKAPLSESQARMWFRDIMRAVAYLHRKNIAHRDLKLDNFLIDENYKALLSDFSFSVLINTDLRRRTICGTVPYMAPEIYLEKAYDPFAADMFSMGVSLFEMLNQDSPFGSATDSQELVHLIANRQYNFAPGVTLSHAILELINSLLSFEPELRLTARQVLNSSWLSDQLK